MITMEEYERQVNINIELQQRTDKSLEYIKDNWTYYCDRLEEKVYKERYSKYILKLLNILNGEYNE